MSKLKKISTRPPIVAVLGHVDHGKTTLLDNIRKSSVAVREAGGITQSIGASVVKTSDNRRITFIDTPGHAAFSNMRSRGAKVADIAILVIAANDGVKPQTKEAISFIREADIPIIVAITKMDLPAVDLDSVKEQLNKEGIKIEGRGGDVPVVALSGKTGKGIKELLEIVNLVSEVSEVKGSKEANLEAVIIETDKDKRGLLATAVVRNGRLGVGDEIVVESLSMKVRGLFDYKSKPIKEALPGDPVQILGFRDLPPVGSRIISKNDFTFKKERTKIEGKREIPEIKEGQIPVVIKASSTGSLEAVLENLPEGVVAVYSGVGDVIENDVFMAKSADAAILAFEAKIPSGVKKLANTEGVVVESFRIIYKLFDRLKSLLKEASDDTTGKAEILAIFPFSGKNVAGCKVIEGKLAKGDTFLVKRADVKIGEAKAISMKREKKDIDVAKAGEELGILFDKKLDFEVGDMVLSIR
jgi:translation initiation factor IF-2